MLNEDKIKLMSGIALFEKKQGKKIFPVCRYFRSDYVSSHMLRSFFSYTISFILCVAVWALYSLDMVLSTMNTDDLLGIGKKCAVYYVTGLVVYLFITFQVYMKRYTYANHGMRIYITKLKRLEKRYEFQNKTRDLAKEGRRNDKSTRV